MKKTYYTPATEALELGMGSSLLNNNSVTGGDDNPDMPIVDIPDPFEDLWF